MRCHYLLVSACEALISSLLKRLFANPRRTCRWSNNGGRKWRGNRPPTSSVNFVIAHDGFTLADLVSYNEKHNEVNGEVRGCAGLRVFSPPPAK